MRVFKSYASVRNRAAGRIVNGSEHGSGFKLRQQQRSACQANKAQQKQPSTMAQVHWITPKATNQISRAYKRIAGKPITMSVKDVAWRMMLSPVTNPRQH